MHVRASWLWVVSLAAIVMPCPLGAQPITESNWQKHPAIVEIRAIYQEIRQAQAAGRLHKVERQWAAADNCEAQPYEDGERVLYRSRRIDRRATGAVFEARYRPSGPVATAAPGTLTHWLTERYCLYAVTRRGELRRAEIHHLPWPLQPAEVEVVTNTMTAGLGVALPTTVPIAHFAERLDVYVWLPTRVTRAA